MTEIKSFFLHGNRTYSFANLTKEDMKGDIKIKLPQISSSDFAENFRCFLPENGNVENFKQEERKIYNLYIEEGNTGLIAKRTQQIDKLIYKPGIYYEVECPYSGNAQYNHSVYVYCVSVESDGPTSIYKDRSDTNYIDKNINLYRYQELTPAPDSEPDSQEPIPMFNGADKELLSLEDPENTGPDALDYKVKILKVKDDYTFEDFKIDDDVVTNPENIPLSDPGAIYILMYDLSKYKIDNLKKILRILSSDDIPEKDVLITKYSDLRYPYQFTAEKYSSIFESLESIRREIGKEAYINFKHNYELNDNETAFKRTGNMTGNKTKPLRLEELGVFFDKNLKIINIDTDTFKIIEQLRNSINYVYDNIKVKTNYAYDSIKWLRFITKYITYDRKINKDSTNISEIRKKLLSQLKKYNISDKQKQELYCFDLYDKDFHKLFYFDEKKPLNSRGNIELKIKPIFENTREQAKTKWTDSNLTTEEKTEFDKLFERKHNFKSAMAKNWLLSTRKEYEVIKTGDEGNITYKAKSKDTGEEIPLYTMELNNAGEAVAYEDSFTFQEQQFIFKNLAGDNSDSKGVLGFEKSEGVMATNWENRKGYRMAEHLEKLLISRENRAAADSGVLGFLTTGTKSKDITTDNEKILGKEDKKFEKYNIGGKKHSRTHKKRKTLKKRSSRRRH